MSAARSEARGEARPARPVPDRGALDRLLWIGSLTGPVAFLTDLLIKYALVEPTCEAGEKTVLHVVTVAMLLVAAVPSVLGWRAWKRFEAQAEEAGEEEWRGLALARGHFLALSAVALGAFSVLAILANAIPGLVFRACQ